MSDHAKKSPSAAHRWVNCPGSIREEANYPDTSGPAAIDGTGSHKLLELLLTDVIENNVVNRIGGVIGLGHKDKTDGWVVDKERWLRVMVAVDYVKQRMKDLGPDVLLLLEDRTDPGEKYGISDLWGTVDITLIINGFIEIIDYKDGFTHVSENTEQLICYAAGQVDYAAKDFFDIQTVKKTIIQPKAFGNQIRSVTHSLEQNDQLFKTIADAALLTEDPNAPLTPGAHCKWCKHQLNCDVRNQLALAAINTPISPINMSNTQLSQANDQVPMIRSFIKSLEIEAEKRIRKGENVFGYAMAVKRNGNRTWINEDEAAKKIKSLTIKGSKLKQTERYVSKLITPSKVLDLDLTKRQRETIEKLIFYPAGSEKLTRVDRPLLSDEEMFGKAPVSSTDPDVKKPLNDEKMKKELDAIFQPGQRSEPNGQVDFFSETEKKKSVKMTLKAEGRTAAEFKQFDSNWTDEMLVKEGYAVWFDKRRPF